MASRGSLVVDRPGAVIVRIDHGVADSFSRSVLPTATRAWHRSPHCRGTTYRDVDLAPDWTLTPDKRGCASFVAFAPTFDAAQAALADYLVTLTATP